METVPSSYFLVVSALLFTIGAAGVLVRRNPIVIFMCIELMLNAANLAFITFSRHLNSLNGQMFVFFIITVAAAEVAVGLGLIVSIFRARRTINVDDIDLMRW